MAESASFHIIMTSIATATIATTSIRYVYRTVKHVPITIFTEGYKTEAVSCVQDLLLCEHIESLYPMPNAIVLSILVLEGDFFQAPQIRST